MPVPGAGGGAADSDAAAPLHVLDSDTYAAFDGAGLPAAETEVPMAQDEPVAAEALESEKGSERAREASAATDDVLVEAAAAAVQPALPREDSAVTGGGMVDLGGDSDQPQLVLMPDAATSEAAAAAAAVGMGAGTGAAAQQHDDAGTSASSPSDGGASDVAAAQSAAHSRAQSRAQSRCGAAPAPELLSGKPQSLGGEAAAAGGVGGGVGDGGSAAAAPAADGDDDGFVDADVFLARRSRSQQGQQDDEIPMSQLVRRGGESDEGSGDDADDAWFAPAARPASGGEHMDWAAQ